MSTQIHHPHNMSSSTFAGSISSSSTITQNEPTVIETLQIKGVDSGHKWTKKIRRPDQLHVISENGTVLYTIEYLKNDGFRLYRGAQSSPQSSIATASFDGSNYHDKKPIRISFDRDAGKSTFIELPHRFKRPNHREWEVDGLQLSISPSKKSMLDCTARQISRTDIPGPLATFRGTYLHTGENYGSIALKTQMDSAMLDLVVLGIISDAEKAYHVNTFTIAVAS
jgi:hypothetical protein